VTDFGTPVQTIETNQTGDRVRMVVTPKGNWEHSAYQSDNQFVLEIRERVVDNTKLTQGPGYSGEKLSLNFQNIEVRSLLQVIADFTSFNVVTSDSVSGSVTLRLKDVPWDQALDIILQAKGLDKRKNGNVLWIAPKDEIAAREKQTLESQASTESLEPVRTQGFQMNYANVEEIAKQISGSGSAGGTGASGTGASARILSARGSVISEPRTNQLFVTDIPSRLEQVQSLIAKLDIPVRQVMIEARIVEASDDFSRSLGVRLGGGNLGVGGGRNRLGFGSTYSATSAGVGSGSFVNLPSDGAGGFNPATLAVSLFDALNTSRFLNLEISAMEADGRGKIVSSPRVVTADQVEALIEQGTKFPFQSAADGGGTKIDFATANLALKVTPRITPEGAVILTVDVTKNSRGETTPAGVAINTKRVKTEVLVEDGGTVVLGGIYESFERDDIAKVPVLGDIPYVGNLFKNKSRITTRSELLVFLTPRIITDRGVSR
jgi:type IV pilus assembly protein PilQ